MTNGGGILVNYVGYPSSIDSLMPDNGIANLAGSLKRAGYPVLVLDCATTDMIGRLVPGQFRGRLKWLLFRFVVAHKLGRKIGGSLSRSFQGLNDEMASYAEGIQKEIADEIVREVKTRRATFVGFKLWTGAGVTGSLNIARRVKEACPGVKIFGGGPHAECFGEKVMDDLAPVFDAVGLGEGEETIVRFAEYAAGKADLGGRVVTDLHERIDDMDSLADPCYEPDVYRAMQGDRKLKLIMLDESRGCPYSCNFCPHPLKSGQGWRVRAPERVADLMGRLAETTGSRTFRLAGSNPPPEHRRGLAEELVKRGSPFEYVSFGHTRAKEEPFELLRKSGCISLFFGVESCSQEVLDRGLNKKTTVEKISNSLTGAKAAGIMTSASLIVPCPFDTQETLQETVDVMASLKPDGVSIYLPIVVPGTTWFMEPERFGIELTPGYEDVFMRYQVRFLMPPPLWDPLPYTIGGRDYGAMVDAASWVSSQLDRRGVVTGTNDSLLLMAREMSLSTMKVRNMNRKLFMTADGKKIGQMVVRFNRSLSNT